MRAFLICAFLVAGVCALSPAALGQQGARRPVTRDRVLGAAARQFNAMDANKDGSLNKAEVDAAIDDALAKLRARLQARFEEADANKDGTITKEEFVAARAKWFADVDANGDGVLDQNEFRAYAKARRGK